MSDSGSGRSTPSGWRRPANTGPRIGRLGDASTPAPSSSSGGRRIATLRDVGSGGGGPSAGGFGGGRHDDDDDDEDDEGPDPQTFFAGGGERSGVSIQGPPGRGPVPGGDVVRDLLRRAAEAGPPPAPSPGPGGARSVFSGGGHVLGGEDVESRYVPDPLAEPQDADAPTAIRRITFWREGFSVDHDDVTGELRRYDDPANAQILREINDGRAPPSILNILPGQPVELRIAKRTHEDYVPPSGSAAGTRAFAGAGHRLGSPVPGQPSSSSGGASGMPGGFPPSAGAGTASAERESVTTRFEVDTTLPTTRVQVRLADGTRLTARMNLTHRVRDLRGFVDASAPGAASRPYTLNTAHPAMKPLEDEEQTIEAAGLANSVVVQRWV